MKKSAKHRTTTEQKVPDICILAEGSYPYYSGGVAQWTHELITEHKERSFYVLTLMPPHPELIFRYKFPKNVIGHSVVIMQNIPEGNFAFQTPPETWKVIKKVLQGLISSKEFEDFAPLLKFCQKYRNLLGKRILFESEESWNFFNELYEEIFPSGPFKAFFSTIYVLTRSLFSVLLPQLPRARLYHALCTGYAGFLLYRAKQEYGVPCFLTEQGVYTNERRIEIAMAEWITDVGSLNLALESKKKTLKHFWLNAFSSMAHVCYLASDEIISTFDGNHEIQLEAGADPKKLHAISHGIDPERYKSLRTPKTRPQTVAFVGRIVPIKDVKTYIRACLIVREALKDVKFYALGPIEEDPEYFAECKQLVEFLGLEKNLIFLGKVDLKKYVSEIDLLVLTSISEAQPLVILELGSAGIPCVATNVGACHQLCFGKSDEQPNLGQGGIVTPLSNPQATAEAIIRMFVEPDFYQACCQNIQKRILTYYRYDQQHNAYRNLYHKHLKSSE